MGRVAIGWGRRAVAGRAIRRAAVLRRGSITRRRGTVARSPVLRRRTVARGPVPRGRPTVSRPTPVTSWPVEPVHISSAALRLTLRGQAHSQRPGPALDFAGSLIQSTDRCLSLISVRHLHECRPRELRRVIATLEVEHFHNLPEGFEEGTGLGFRPVFEGQPTAVKLDLASWGILAHAVALSIPVAQLNPQGTITVGEHVSVVPLFTSLDCIIDIVEVQKSTSLRFTGVPISEHAGPNQTRGVPQCIRKLLVLDALGHLPNEDPDCVVTHGFKKERPSAELPGTTLDG
mmetsp:Transcript_10652/g.23492  ORF Transcript_10652/g.23492 Transcript_10652/m.23492 type:complete len:289 (-) Transcript_10652:22-888(-)